MQPQDSEPSQKPSKGYSKWSKRQLIVAYVVAAIVIYGLVYYFFIRKTGTSVSAPGY